MLILVPKLVTILPDGEEIEGIEEFYVACKCGDEQTYIFDISDARDRSWLVFFICAWLLRGFCCLLLIILSFAVLGREHFAFCNEVTITVSADILEVLLAN